MHARFLLFLLLLVAACTSSREYLSQGQYDRAMAKSIHKLKNKPSKEKEIVVLEKAYRLAQERDLQQINLLKAEGSPDNWDQIFGLYSQIGRRQAQVKPLLPLKLKGSGRLAEFKMINVDQDLIQAKQKAAEYYYVHATQLLSGNPTRDAARRAYAELQRVQSFYPNYKDVKNLQQQALQWGTSQVLFKIQNKSGMPLPNGFEEELFRININELDQQWINYTTHEQKGVKYDYQILVNLTNLLVSPEQVRERMYIDTRQVLDGFDYVLDAKGNVMKDTAGNDIKVPRKKMIECRVEEVNLYKRATISGNLQFIQQANGEVLKSDPIMADAFFDHCFARAFGDLTALSPESQAKLGKGPRPFPTNPELILLAAANLKNMVKDVVYHNRGLVR